MLTRPLLPVQGVLPNGGSLGLLGSVAASAAGPPERLNGCPAGHWPGVGPEWQLATAQHAALGATFTGRPRRVVQLVRPRCPWRWRLATGVTSAAVRVRRAPLSPLNASDSDSRGREQRISANSCHWREGLLGCSSSDITRVVASKYPFKFSFPGCVTRQSCISVKQAGLLQLTCRRQPPY